MAEVTLPAFMGGWLEPMSGFAECSRLAMVAYSSLYLAVVLAIAIYHFAQRDL
ncbi:MAG TPA: hypothetical protein VMB85_13640 [Bryobacteraceae bacterium]|nr:hypothetical protein [Bryobacteraceae bacterium]